MSASPERRVVHYAGNVQGVSFRYTARRIAEGFSVAGWVRNLPDGRVLMTVEGLPEELDRFLAAVARRMEGYIATTQVQRAAATGESKGFEIRT